MKKSNTINIGKITFKYSSIIEGYYADLGSHQVQLLSDDGIHWRMVLNAEAETTSHSADDTAKLAYDMLKEKSKHV